MLETLVKETVSYGKALLVVNMSVRRSAIDNTAAAVLYRTFTIRYKAGKATGDIQRSWHALFARYSMLQVQS